MINELSIIIPTLNESNYLPNLLTSIAQQTYNGKLEVIVVDGKSKDKTKEKALTFKNKLKDLHVIETKANVGHQRNVGARQAKYRYLLFIDADVTFPPELLQKFLVKVKFSGPFVIGTYHTSEDISLIDRVFLSLAYLLLFASWAAKVPAVNGDFMLTTRDNFKNVHGFAEGAILGEDVDFAIRSVKNGAKFRYYMSPKIFGHARRVREMGRFKLLMLWSRGYIYVLRHGPVYPGQGFEYRFGHYDDIVKDSTLPKI